MATMLEKLYGLNKNIYVGVVGIGSIGKGIAVQATITPGIECVAIADRNLDRTSNWAESNGWDFEVVDSLSQMYDAIQLGKLAICDDGNLVAQCKLLDVFIESTSSVVEGGLFGVQAIDTGMHVIMMNHESDLMFGPYLLHLANQKGVQYTVADGDQPAVIKHLVDEMRFMGFDLVMAGNIKGYLDRYTNPTLIIPEADKRGLKYKMCSSYTDGTKLGVEMAVVANGLNLVTDVPGMHGPRLSSVHEVFDYFDFEKMWDGKQGIVEYILGALPKGGVFTVGYTDHPHQVSTLSWFPPDMGPGPFYLFYKPYHLGHFEIMKTVANVMINGEPTLQPIHGFKTNVFAYAKKDLRAGEVLDGIGGYACYGLIDNNKNGGANGLPICLAEDVKLIRDIPKDGKIQMDDIKYDPKSISFDLYSKAKKYSKL